MGQRLLTLRVRPARVAMLISDTATPNDFVMAVQFMSQIWGGRFNPIIPVSANQPDPLTHFRLSQVRPDFVFGLKLDDEQWEPAVRRACQPRKYFPFGPSFDISVSRPDQPSLIHSAWALLAEFERRSKPSAIVRPVKTVSVDKSSHWLPYFAALFGILPDGVSEKYRSEHVVVEVPSSVELVNTHRDFVDGWKQSLIDAGSFGLTSHFMLSPVVEPTIVIVKDLIPDLCLFWNIRLASDPATPAWVVPIAHSEIDNDGTLSSLKNWLLAFREYGSRPNYCRMTSTSMDQRSIEGAAARLQRLLAGTGIEYVDYEPPKNRLPKIVAFEQNVTWPAEFHRRRMTVVPPTPKAISFGGADHWFVDILRDNQTGRAVGEMELPESPVIPEILNAGCPPRFELAHIARFGDGIDSINFRCGANDPIVRYQIPTAQEVLEETLREAGYEIVHDEKRSSYLPVIGRLGGLYQAAKALSGKCARALEVLRSNRLRSPIEYAADDDYHQQEILIAQGHALTLDQIREKARLGGAKHTGTNRESEHDLILQHTSERVRRIAKARYQKYSRAGMPDADDLRSLLEYWSENAVLERKVRLKQCSRCRRDSFVTMLDLRSLPKCVHCGRQLRVSGNLEVAYSLQPPVRHALSEGLGTVVLAGQFLQNMTGRGFFWLPGVKVKRSTEKSDVDLLACCDGHLVFGECKRLTGTPHDAASWRKTAEQFLSLASIAIECRGAFVVLAAMVEDFPCEVRNQIAETLRDRIPFLLLTKADLERGFTNVEGGARSRSLQLSDLVPIVFPETPVERSGGPRHIKLPWGGVFSKGTSAQRASEVD